MFPVNVNLVFIIVLLKSELVFRKALSFVSGQTKSTKQWLASSL